MLKMRLLDGLTAGEIVETLNLSGKTIKRRGGAIEVHDLWITNIINSDSARTLFTFNPAIRVVSLGRIRKTSLCFNDFIVTSASGNLDFAPRNPGLFLLNRWKIHASCRFSPFQIQLKPTTSRRTIRASLSGMRVFCGVGKYCSA